MPTPALINHYARALIRGALAKGVDFNALCAAIDIAPAPLEQMAFGPPHLAALSRCVKLMLKDEFCGLTRTPCKPGSFQLMCELLVTSETLAEALSRAFRFYGLVSDDIAFALQQQGNTATVTVVLAPPPLPGHDFLYEWWLGLWRGVSSWLIGEELRVTAVEFPHQPSVPAAEYAEAFSRPCSFSQPRAALSFERHALARPVIRDLADLWEWLNSHRNIDLVSILGVQAGLKARLKAQLVSRFSQTQRFPSMEEIAEQLHISSQTLRRRLDEENYSYRALKEDIRREVVMKWLDNPEIPIVEVSRMGGFAEPNGLTRAVKTWIGMSPKAYRAGLAQGREGSAG